MPAVSALALKRKARKPHKACKPPIKDSIKDSIKVCYVRLLSQTASKNVLMRSLGCASLLWLRVERLQKCSLIACSMTSLSASV